jgi:hypothetical protein
MVNKQCCGSDSWNDFQSATLWVKSKNDSAIKIPEACCKMNETASNNVLLDKNCPTSPTKENSYMNTVSILKV